jgi:hypothetical protein
MLFEGVVASSYDELYCWNVDRACAPNFREVQLI